MIDAYNDLLPQFAVPERQTYFPPALVNRLRDLRVTARIVLELDASAGTALTLPAQNLAATLDNRFLLRTVEAHSSLRQMVLVL